MKCVYVLHVSLLKCMIYVKSTCHTNTKPQFERCTSTTKLCDAFFSNVLGTLFSGNTKSLSCVGITCKQLSNYAFGNTIYWHQISLRKKAICCSRRSPCGSFFIENIFLAPQSVQEKCNNVLSCFRSCYAVLLCKVT